MPKDPYDDDDDDQGLGVDLIVLKSNYRYSITSVYVVYV